MDSVLEGVLDLLYGAGYLMLYDDKGDILNPKAHPGLHHWHYGAVLTNVVEIAHIYDMYSKLKGPVPPVEDLIVNELVSSV